ncbi:L,D-transpeptidase family protein [Lichenihabitans psoromatis]|uniref:L,D-transpeptidase family protein n=1 Tax=Lichenihabitans psoromatis TaxID=2528642 RepID=UPI001036DE62|nr:murein L,D-transpeptidase family protein [Lichenihabitans psoromatis]
MSVSHTIRRLVVLALALAGAALLAGCEETGSSTSYRAFAPIPPATEQLMATKGTMKDAPMLIRAYKKEAELEVWKRKPDGKYVYLKTFPMCRWSGQLGPKVTEGDRQVPEGFYTITPGQMNPNSHYYLSFNVGYPNAYDRANGHTGGSIMVHGICSSAGCFSMTDKEIEEIYALARESFAGGQRAIQMQSYPFRMTAENIAKLRLDPNMPFWRELKKGSDLFDVTKTETPVGVCNRHYVFGASPKGDARFDALSSCPPLNEDPAVKAEVAAKEQRDNAEVAALVTKGVKPVRIIYADGGQHESFAHQIADVSRADALAAGATEIALDAGPKSKSVAVQVAAAKAASKVLLAKGNVGYVPPTVAINETGSIKPVAVPSAPIAVATNTTTVAASAPVGAVLPMKTAQAEMPATFNAAPSAYAKTETKDEPLGFLNKWINLNGPKPEAAPVVQASAPPVQLITTGPESINHGPLTARKLGAAASKAHNREAAAPTKTHDLTSTLPKATTDHAPLPKSAMATTSTVN